MEEPKIQELVTADDIAKRVKFNLHHEIIEYLIYFLKVFSAVALVFIIVKSSVFTHFNVSGSSMYPNYKDQQIVYINKFTPNFADYQRGDVVVIKRPKSDCDGDKNCYFIKRIVAIPQESVLLEDGKVFVTNKFYPEGFALDESSYLAQEVKTFKDRYKPDGLETVNEGQAKSNQYYVLGDNRGASKDSRYFGFIDKGTIEGKVFYQGGEGFTELPAYK